ncbi:MAG: bifunctional tetrahydrofolate synthase/dihydrofolate synthase [Legionella sp.]|nr:MAG: bifunctional tetrahydrofolate synthase/dihydrofolate synthase [Legionella sp.]
MRKLWSDWDLNQWLSIIESRNTQEIQLGLTRIREVAQKLSLLNPECKVITVTGTNGKGSTVAALETLYHTAGYQVGTYTSPHLIRFNERIRLNRCPVSDDAICLAFRYIEEARGDIVLTYFEMATLAALWLFHQHPLDIMILEVGIGGRLDATNIIDADLAIITTVALDHQDYLGESLEAIAFEKAGIMREGNPFIYGDLHPPATIAEAANRLEIKGYYYGQDYSFNEYAEHWEIKGIGLSQTLPKPQIQLKSAAMAILATTLFHSILPISQEQLALAMQKIFIPGRLQWVKGNVEVLYDVSHNPQSAELLAATLKKRDQKTTVHGVFSALKDKDLLGIISPLKDCIDHWYPAQLDTKRATSSTDLLAKFQDAEIFLDVCYTSPLVAFETALEQANLGDLIVVFGSFYTVGQVMAAQHNLFEQETQ